jgi:hypothetical protein
MGLINKLTSKVASKALTKAAPKVVLSLSEQMAEEAAPAAPVKKALVAPKKASKAVKAAEPSPPTSTLADEPVEAVADEPVVLSLSERMAKESNVAAQTDEMLAAPEPVESKYTFPNKAFSDEQYAAAEKELEDSFLMASMYKKLKGNDEKFANELQKKAAKMFGSKEEKYQMPYEIESKAMTIDEVLAEAAAKPKTVKPATRLSSDYLSGDLGKSRTFTSTDAKLEGIRQHRERTFRDLMDTSRADRYDDPVLAVAQGDFRDKYGYEVNLTSKGDAKRLFKLMDEKQRQYNSLKKKYQNTPEITLYHGGAKEDIENIARGGFDRPTTAGRESQVELQTGAVSTTRDVVLDFRQFGQSPENIVGTKMPYAEYVFKRVNMSDDQYSDKNLNVLARTITGSPTEVRPLQIPRDAMYETESTIVEADKLNMRRMKDELGGKFKEYEQIYNKRTSLAKDIETLGRTFTTPEQMSATDAAKGYAVVRDYVQNLAKLGKMSNVRSGMGQQFINMLLSLSSDMQYLSKLEKRLDQLGMTEKAQNISKLREVSSDDTIGNEQALKLVDKFNRGGLVKRK